MRMNVCVALGVVVVAAVAISAAADKGKSVSMPRDKQAQGAGDNFTLIEERAREATENDVNAIRRLTDEIFDQSILSSASESLRERVFRSEMAFRHGSQAPISDADIVAVVNDGTKHLKTHDGRLRLTLGQFRMMKENVRVRVPHLDKRWSDKTIAKDRLPDEMSPAEAVLVSADGMLQKLVNPVYRMAPEQWEHNVRRQRGWMRDHPWGKVKVASPRAALLPLDEDMETVMALQQGLSDETSMVTQKAHDMLSALGVPR